VTAAASLDPSDPRAADRPALARLGAEVRARLGADPSVYQLEGDKAEVFAVADFLSGEECDRLVAMIDAVARPSEIYGADDLPDYRTSYSGDVDPHDSFVRMIERRLGDLIGIDLSWGETFQGQRYAPGQQFQAHCDWFDPAHEHWASEVASGGQRCWTAMVYLNNVEEGGETEFPTLGFAIPPQRGALVLWNNALPDGLPNPDTIHAARPVVRGVKYVITKWFRTRPWG